MCLKFVPCIHEPILLCLLKWRKEGLFFILTASHTLILRKNVSVFKRIKKDLYALHQQIIRRKKVPSSQTQINEMTLLTHECTIIILEISYKKAKEKGTCLQSRCVSSFVSWENVLWFDFFFSLHVPLLLLLIWFSFPYPPLHQNISLLIHFPFPFLLSLIIMQYQFSCSCSCFPLLLLFIFLSEGLRWKLSHVFVAASSAEEDNRFLQTAYIHTLVLLLSLLLLLPFLCCCTIYCVV